jgi:serine/threonine-protein kinase
MASVVKVDIDWTRFPDDLPQLIIKLLRRCLQAEPRQRLHDIADFRLEIEDYLANPTEETSETIQSAVSMAPAWKRTLPWAVAGLFAIAIILTLIATQVFTPQPDPRPLTRTAIVLPSDQQLSYSGRHQVAFSPDGQHLVYVANGQLYLRAMDQLEATPIRGTAERGGRSPFFSPDGQWVGFYAGDLKKVAITGGAPVKLCDAVNPWGASWGADDRIVFGQGAEGIFQVSANGGEKELLIRMDSESEAAHGPQILPGGEAVLFTLRSGGGPWDDAQIMVQALETGERKVLVNGGTDARYVPTGHLVYVQEGTLLAVPFDVARLEVTGGRVPIVEGVAQALANFTGAAQFTFSDLGALVYVSGNSSGMNRTLVWVDREGNEEPLDAEPRSYSRPELSPDGEHLAITVADGRN